MSTYKKVLLFAVVAAILALLIAGYLFVYRPFPISPSVVPEATPESLVQAAERMNAVGQNSGVPPTSSTELKTRAEMMNQAASQK